MCSRLTSIRQVLPLSRRAYSTTSRVPLAFDLHKPPKEADEQNAPIVFMHGLFGSKKNNRGISKALAKALGRPIYAVDLRNHGDSPHNPKHDYVVMADDVEGFIEEHNLVNTTLIGHSMGAKTAMTLALKSPNVVSNIVSVDNAPIDAALLSSFAKYIEGMKKIESIGVKSLSEALEILKPYEESLTIRQFLLGNLYQPQNETKKKFKCAVGILSGSLDNLGDFPFKDPEKLRFEKPTLIVRGTQSPYVPDEALPVIGRFFPRFTLADIDAGHWVVSEQPEEFKRVVVDFLTPPE